MTYISNDIAAFKDEMLAGFVSAYSRFVAKVPGSSGVVVPAPVRGRVALVIGGGAGHYPASAGLVGEGLATGAVVGEVFTSPSAEQVHRVAQAAESGAGVLLCFGNYAGDVINFNGAAKRLNDDGVPCEVVVVTDDIASAGPDEVQLRRGVAGSLAVYKIAGAAAARGLPLTEVARIARDANARTRTLGVAFAGCTLPGQSEPLFTLPPGQLGLGMGIHGEAGTSTSEIVSARDLARILVERLVTESPAVTDGRAAVVLNGLGSISYEELFVLWNEVAVLLADTGIEAVEPEVGEFMTSLDMAGCSLSLTWLDDELTELWGAPAATPAFRRGGQHRFASASHTIIAPPVETPTIVVEERPDALADAARRALRSMLETVVAHERELGRIDAVAGDGDHGSGMVRGLRAAVAAAAASGGGGRTTIILAGRAWADEAGGTSGALWGALLEAFALVLPTHADALDGVTVAQAVRAAVDAVQRLGGAVLGDKTMVDAMEPFAARLAERIDAGEQLSRAWRHAASAATEAAQSTAALRPRLGRARPLAERSIGTVDAGATSFALCVTAITTAMTCSRATA